MYYNFRHYNPEDGRWINRDPIGEAGGANLYHFIFNALHNSYDIMGLLKDNTSRGTSSRGIGSRGKPLGEEPPPTPKQNKAKPYIQNSKQPATETPKELIEKMVAVSEALINEFKKNNKATEYCTRICKCASTGKYYSTAIVAGVEGKGSCNTTGTKRCNPGDETVGFSHNHLPSFHGADPSLTDVNTAMEGFPHKAHTNKEGVADEMKIPPHLPIAVAYYNKANPDVIITTIFQPNKNYDGKNNQKKGLVYKHDGSYSQDEGAYTLGENKFDVTAKQWGH